MIEASDRQDLRRNWNSQTDKRTEGKQIYDAPGGWWLIRVSSD